LKQVLVILLAIEKSLAAVKLVFICFSNRSCSSRAASSVCALCFAFC